MLCCHKSRISTGTRKFPSSIDSVCDECVPHDIIPCTRGCRGVATVLYSMISFFWNLFLSRPFSPVFKAIKMPFFRTALGKMSDFAGSKNYPRAERFRRVTRFQISFSKAFNFRERCFSGGQGSEACFYFFQNSAGKKVPRTHPM